MNYRENWAIVCTKSFYAGQGISFEIGYLKAQTMTREEADAIHESMISLAYGDKECWIVVSTDEYFDKYCDFEIGPKSAKKLRAIFDRRDKCPKPHNYVPPSNHNTYSSYLDLYDLR